MHPAAANSKADNQILPSILHPDGQLQRRDNGYHAGLFAQTLQYSLIHRLSVVTCAQAKRNRVLLEGREMKVGNVFSELYICIALTYISNTERSEPSNEPCLDTSESDPHLSQQWCRGESSASERRWWTVEKFRVLIIFHWWIRLERSHNQMNFLLFHKISRKYFNKAYQGLEGQQNWQKVS
jgi:hypothetical protein